jgi:hypothetical protein
MNLMELHCCIGKRLLRFSRMNFSHNYIASGLHVQHLVLNSVLEKKDNELLAIAAFVIWRGPCKGICA